MTMMVTSMTTKMVTTWAVKMTLLILLLMMIVRLAIGPTTPSLLSAGIYRIAAHPIFSSYAYEDEDEFLRY